MMRVSINKKERFKSNICFNAFLYALHYSDILSYFLSVDDDYELSESQVAILGEAMEQVKETVNRATTSHRDLHSTVSKVGKAIDRVSAVQYT